MVLHKIMQSGNKIVEVEGPEILEAVKEIKEVKMDDIVKAIEYMKAQGWI